MTKPLGPYTPVVRAGDWLIVSGQLGQLDGKLVEGLGAQTSQVVANLTTLLEGEGAALTDIAKTLCFLVDFSPEVFATFNDAYVAGFAGHRPLTAHLRTGRGRPAALACCAWLESSRSSSPSSSSPSASSCR